MKNAFSMLKKVFCLGLLLAFWAIPTSLIKAEDVSYDRYAPVYEKTPKAPSTGHKAATRFLIAPFELLKWSMDRSLVFTEKYKLDKKGKWFYDKLQDYGVTPRVSAIAPNRYGVGADFDFVRMAQIKDKFPDAIAKGRINYDYDVIFDVQAEAGWNRIASTGLFTKGVFDYSNRPRENFYGIGPHSSLGDGYVYQQEETLLQYLLGYSFNPTLDLTGKFAFRNVNISGGHDGGRGQWNTGIFTPENTPGLGGERILTFGTEIKQDTRNQKELSTKGGLRRFAFNYNKGLGASHASYFKYLFELTQYFRLGSDRRIFVFHFVSDNNSETRHHYVPFYDMARLGDFGAYPRIGYTLRGYGFNRFYDNSSLLFNFEYRYTVFEYRDWQLDAVFFNDLGQVFEQLSEFQFSNFRDGYGLGARISAAKKMLLSLEVAHSNEGTTFYVKTNAPF